MNLYLFRDTLQKQLIGRQVGVLLINHDYLGFPAVIPKVGQAHPDALHIGPHPEDVLHMRRTADRLFGNQYQWSVLGGGRNQMYIATQSAVMGGNVRVGLEDSLWIGKGQLAKTNADQVSKIRRILEELGLEVFADHPVGRDL